MQQEPLDAASAQTQTQNQVHDPGGPTLTGAQSQRPPTQVQPTAIAGPPGLRAAGNTPLPTATKAPATVSSTTTALAPPQTLEAGTSAAAPQANQGNQAQTPPGGSNIAQIIDGYLQELEAVRNPAQASRLHCELGRLLERATGDDRRAVQHYKKSLEGVRGHRPAIHGLRMALLRLGEFSGALPLFDQEVEAQEDAQARAHLWYRKGVLLEDRLRRRDAALQAYEAAVELDPNLGSAWQAIAQLTSLTGDYARCDAALAACANLAEHDPTRRSALLSQRARILELRLENPARATEVYEAALALNPDNQLARQALARLYYSGKRFADLSQLLETSAESDVGELRARALQFAATVHSHKLQRRPEAVAALRKALTAEEQPHVALLQSLGDALESSSNHDGLLHNLRQRLAAEPEPAERLSLLKRNARLLEEHGDADGCLINYEEAFTLSPLDREVSEALQRHYQQRGDADALLSLLDRQLEQEQDLEMRTVLLLRKGRILQGRGDGSEAIAILLEALSLEPDSGEVFRALEALYLRHNHSADLCGLYRQRADLDTTHHAERVSLLLRAAQLEEGPLNKPEAAAHTYRQVLRLEPGHGTALSALQHVSARAGLYDQLVDALELEVAHTQSVQVQAALLHHTALVLLEHKQDRKGATARLQRALAADAKHLPSLLTLEQIQRDDGRYEDLLQTLERRLERTRRPERRVALLLHMSEVAEEKLGDGARALGYARAAAQEGPDNPHARQRLIELLRLQEDFESLSSVLQAELESLTSPAHKALCALRIAEIQELRIGDPRKALQFYELAYKGDPALGVAFDGWLRVALGLGEYKRLAAELEHRATEAQNPELRRRLRVAAAELQAQRMGNLKQAKALLSQASQEHPLPLDVLLLQESIEQRTGAADELWATLQAKVHLCADELGKSSALLHQLRVCSREECSDSAARRIAVLTALHELGAADPEALEELQMLLLSRGEFHLIAPLDQAVQELAQDPTQRAVHLCHFAESYEDIDALAAEDTYQRALNLDNQCLGAVRGLGRLALQGKDPDALAQAAVQELRLGGNQVLASRYYQRAAQLLHKRAPEKATVMLERALDCQPDSTEIADALTKRQKESGDVQGLIDTLHRAAECAQIPERKRDLWLRMSELQQDPLNNVAGALVSARKAVEATPNHLPALLVLARLQRCNRRADEAAELLRTALHKAGPDTPLNMLRDVHFELATIYEENLQDTERAIKCLQEADKLASNQSPVLNRMARLQARAGNHEEAISTAQRLLQSAGHPSGRAVGWLLLAETQQAAGQTAAAEDSLCEAVAEVGPLTAAGDALTAKLKGQQDGPSGAENRYVQAVLRYCQTAAEPQVTGALLAAAAFQADVLGDPAAACQTLQTVDVAAHRALRAALAKYLHQAGQHREAMTHLQPLIQRCPWEPSYLQLLFAAQEALGQQGPAATTAEVLDVLDAATEAQRALVTDYRHAGAAPQDPMPLQKLQAVVGDLDNGLVIEQLLVALRPAYPRLFSSDLDGYNVDAQTPLNQTPEHPTMRLANHLAALFGAPEFKLYLHRSRSQRVAFEVGEPGAILIPSHIRDLPPAAQRYALTPPILALAMGLELTLKLTPRELQILLSAACRQLVRSYGDGLTSEEVLEQQNRQIQRALPRRNRKLMEPLLIAYMDLGAHDLGTWVQERHEGLQKVAALASNDLSLVMDELRKSDKPLESLSGQELAKKYGPAADMLRYWLSNTSTIARPHLAV